MTGPMTQTVLDRFWRRVEFDPNGGCWLWSGAARLNRARTYGSGHFRGDVASRFSYSAFVGPIPKGQFVCHKCDVPACVNPAHLFLGSARDNTLDMMRKGRGTFCDAKRAVAAGKAAWANRKEPPVKGELQHLAKLTASTAAHVLAMRGKTSAAALARSLGVTESTIRSVWKRRTWKHVEAAQ